MRIIELDLFPEELAEESLLQKAILQKMGWKSGTPFHYKLIRRSLDARFRKVKYHVQLQVANLDEPLPDPVFEADFRPVSDAPEVVVVGAGPAGLFAALQLISLGLKPVVIERGKDVRARRRDLAALNKEGIVNPDSNYCFGEGGAGTYSDGKLYTRSHKRGSIERILQLLVAHGAKPDILIDAHPHIGTNKLPALVTALSDTIRHFGGEILFETRLQDLILDGNMVKGVQLADGRNISCKAVILATGHSARDIFELFARRDWEILAKPFALGVRIEHDQQLIDKVQYHCEDRGPYLPPASYKLVEQVQGRGVFSFCMCPGGIIAPAATAPGEVVVNGWSPSKRDGQFANSGMVVAVDEPDFKPYAAAGELRALRYQQAIEVKAFEAGGGGVIAPAQRVVDFVEGKLSNTLPATSYLPGVKSALLDEVLPAPVSHSLKGALQAFGKKMKGYYSNDAVLVGVESRTSSPVRIPRDRETLMHTQLEGLFPSGEGAGYAGGIVSAAMDGENCAKAVARWLNR